MMFNKHGTFYARSSWPRKGLITIEDDSIVVTLKNEFEVADKFGIGRGTVTLSRYWTIAMEYKNNPDK